MYDAVYRVSNITMRPGCSRRFIHIEVENSKCYIEKADVGERGLIRCVLDDCDRVILLHTSTIENIESNDDNSVVVITTMNTIYTLLEDKDGIL